MIVSFSDAHSPPNLGREATLVEAEVLTYSAIAQALRGGKQENRIVETWEFFPEEGMYHYDGHRLCDIRWSPGETKKHKGRCPECGRPVTVGVMNRVEELADRPEGYKPVSRPTFRSLVPLPEIIADGLELGKKTKGVAAVYESIVSQHASEFEALITRPIDELKTWLDPMVVLGIERMRQGKVGITPGYDGVYGTVEIFSNVDRKKMAQGSLF